MYSQIVMSWWRHQMETFSVLLAFSAGNSPVPGEFPSQRQVTHSFDISFDLRLNTRLYKQSWGWWFETPSSPLWRYRNEHPWFFIHVMQKFGWVTQAKNRRISRISSTMLNSLKELEIHGYYLECETTTKYLSTAIMIHWHSCNTFFILFLPWAVNAAKSCFINIYMEEST